jgi:hypothetical protein
MRMLKQHGNDVLVLFGSPPPLPSENENEQYSPIMTEGQWTPAADYCELVSRHGKVTVGVAGEDRIPTKPGGGLFQKLGALFSGESTC